MTSDSLLFSRIAVIGAGAWGTSLAYHLAQGGRSVRLWAYEPDTVQAIRAMKQNKPFLPGVTLPDLIWPTVSLSEAVQDTSCLFLAVPSHAMRSVVRNLSSALPKPIPVIVATKGIEEGTLQLMSQVIIDELSSDWSSQLTILTGPSFAVEVCHGKPTTILLAGQDMTLSSTIQSLLMTPSFRVYTSYDTVGAQLGGALKNVMAIAAGVVDGLQLGLNARAALITRGLAEMIRLGKSMGAEVQTFYGLSGLGDLVLTCTGNLSRNHTVGVKLGQGQTMEQISHGTRTVAEGVTTTKAARELAERLGVEMPIVQGVHAILFEGQSPRHTVSELMGRASKMESEGGTHSDHVRKSSEAFS